MKLKKTTVFSLLLTVLCGCTAQPSIDTNNMLETKTYLYSYDYETEPNGELSTAYHEEKPSVDLNESRNVEKGTVNFKNKNAITYIKMNETFSKGNYECTVTEAYKTIFCVKIHLKYTGSQPTNMTFYTTGYSKQTDNLMYDPGLLIFIDKALANEEKDVLYLEPGKEYDLWFFYHVLGTYSSENTYYIQGDFQNYNDHKSYTGYLIELNDLTEID